MSPSIPTAKWLKVPHTSDPWELVPRNPAISLKTQSFGHSMLNTQALVAEALWLRSQTSVPVASRV